MVTYVARSAEGVGPQGVLAGGHNAGQAENVVGHILAAGDLLQFFLCKLTRFLPFFAGRVILCFLVIVRHGKYLQ